MLKSKFNLSQQEEGENVAEEERLYNEAGGEAVAEEEKIVYPEKILDKPTISNRLSLLGKTADGDGYTYLKTSCTNLGLTNVNAIKCFHHLQFVDFSENNLDLEALQVVAELPYLVLIHADKNRLHSAALKKAKYLQVMIFNYNQINSVHDVFQPELCTLEVGYNKIRSLNFQNAMPTIKCLDFRYNLIEEITGINFPNLDSLYLAGNKIKILVGLERLLNLRILHVRNNPIKLLDGFDAGMTKLQYINLRNCKVRTLRQVRKLKVLIGLDTLVMKGCPYMGGTGEEDAEVAQEEEDSETRVEVLATLSRLKRINKGVVTPEERTEAKDLMKQWLEEGDKDEEEEVEEEHEEESNAD